MNNIKLGEDGERRCIHLRLLPNERVLVLEAWHCAEEDTWERMVTPFGHMDDAIEYIEATYK